MILAVGSARTRRLRELNIRTIFDLERALDSTALSRRLLMALLEDPAAGDADGASVVNGTDIRSHAPLREGSSELVLDPKSELDALVSIIRDDLHVQRLRQIWDVTGDRLKARPAPSAEAPAVISAPLPLAAQ